METQSSATTQEARNLQQSSSTTSPNNRTTYTSSQFNRYSHTRSSYQSLPNRNQPQRNTNAILPSPSRPSPLTDFRNTIYVNHVPDIDGENLDEILISIAVALSVPFSRDMINRANRVQSTITNPTPEDPPRNISYNLNNNSIKNRLCHAVNVCKPTLASLKLSTRILNDAQPPFTPIRFSSAQLLKPIFINEATTALTRQLRQQMKVLKARYPHIIKTFYTHNGTLHIRTGEPDHPDTPIYTQEDLDAFEETLH
jgi:hypothetical protein